jgi:hypothetical protein
VGAVAVRVEGSSSFENIVCSQTLRRRDFASRNRTNYLFRLRLQA